MSIGLGKGAKGSITNGAGLAKAEQTAPIIITGMHRSGTSLAGALLANAGVNLGGHQISAEQQHPGGYFEDTEILALNREMLQTAARSGKAGHPDWGWTEDESLNLDILEPFKDRAKGLIKARARAMSAGGRWGWRDPRTTLLLDFWESLLFDARYLFIYRRPWDVGDSMQRLGTEVFLRRPDYAWRIWTFYNRRLLLFRILNQKRSLLVSAEMIQRQPGRLLDLLEARFCLNLELARRNVAKIIDSDLFQAHVGHDPLVALASAANPEAASLLKDLDEAADLSGGELQDGPGSRTTLAVGTNVSAPRLSVIIPCFNQGEYLTEAVASVERSVEEPCELIIVNDGSTEARTLEVLDVLRSAHYHIIDQRNSGLSAARNLGINSARGRYILPLDADNRLRPGFVSKALTVLEARPGVGVVYSDRNDFGLRNETVDVPQFEPDLLLPFNCIDACAVFRKEVWSACGGYDKEAAPWEDWDLWIGAVERGWLFQHLEVTGFDYRVRPESMLSADADDKLRRRLFAHVIAKHEDLYRHKLTAILLAAQRYGIALHDLARKHERRCAEITPERTKPTRKGKAHEEQAEANTFEDEAPAPVSVSLAATRANVGPASPQPPIRAPFRLAPLILPKQINDKSERIDELLGRARELVAGWNVAKLFRPFFRKQRSCNALLLETVCLLAKTNVSLVNRIHHLTACIQTQNGSIASLTHAQIQEIQSLLAQIGDQDTRIATIEAQSAQASSACLELRSDAQACNDDFLAQFSAFRLQMEGLNSLALALQTQAEAMGTHLPNLQTQTDGLDCHFRNLQAQTDALGTHVVNLNNDTRPAIERLALLETDLERIRAQANWIGRHINSLKAPPNIDCPSLGRNGR